MGPGLEKIPCALEHNVCSALVFFKWNVLQISIKSTCSVVSFKISAALLILCLEVLSCYILVSFSGLALCLLVFYVLGCSLIRCVYVTSVKPYGFGSCVIIYCPLSLKSVFSVKGIAVPSFLSFLFAWSTFSQALIVNLCVTPLPWSGSLTGSIVEPFFFLNPVCNSASFTPLTFKVIIDNYVFIATLNLFSHWFYIFSFSFCGFMIFSCITLKFSSFCFFMNLFCFWFVLTLFFKDINPFLYLLSLDC